MEINDRIRMIIESHQLSAGAFADRIGVQRSNVSHILTGRNKPGFEFLEKVLLAFPKVQAHWLITGKHLKQEGSINLQAEPVQQPEPKPYVIPQSNQSAADAEKKVVKIVTFYDDFTFETYMPSPQRSKDNG